MTEAVADPGADVARLRAIVAEISYRDWRLAVLLDGTRPYLQAFFTARCAITAVDGMVAGRKWLLSPHMTRSEVVQTALLAVLTATEHEVREAFRYHGKPVFAPHFNVEELVALCAQPRDARQ